MKKNSGKNLGKILTCAGVLLALVAFFMMFAPAVTRKILSKTVNISGTDLAFGYSENGVKLLGASANIVTYILLLAGIACAVLAVLGKGGNIARIVSVACFVVAGIFFFCSIAFASFYPEMESGKIKDGLVEELKKALSLGAGSIVGGILSILAGAVVAVPVFLKK